MFNAVKRIITVILAFLLIYLFTVPAMFVSRLCADLDTQCRAAELAVSEGDSPEEHLLSMKSRIDGAAKKLHLFLDHTAVDAMVSAIHALPSMTEESDLLPALEALRAELIHLKNIETLDLYTLF